MTYEEILALAPKQDCSAEESARALAEQKAQMLNNETGSLNVDGIDCELCRNKGAIYVVTDYGEVVYRKCECLEKRRELKLQKSIGLSSEFTGKTFDDFKANTDWRRTMLSAAKHYAEVGIKNGNWFYISGSSGSGKTLLCSAIVNAISKQGYNVRYASWRDLIGTLKAMAMDRDSSMKRLELLRDIQSIEVLYLDDLFKTGSSQKIPPTAADICTTFDIVNARYANNKVTIFSSESSLSDLMNIDNALSSRIMQKAGSYNIALGIDVRMNYRING